MSTRDSPLQQHFSVPSIECELDRVHRTRLIYFQCYFHCTVSIDKPGLDFNESRRNQSHSQHLGYVGADYNNHHLSIHLSQHLVLLGLPKRGL